LQKVQIHDVASENRIQSKNEPRGGFLYTARGLFFSVNFTAIFSIWGRHYDRPHWETSDNNTENQKRAKNEGDLMPPNG
jgi:hypothetical protein